MELLQSIGILDIVLIAIISISMIIGLIRGAIREVLSLVGLVVAIYLAFKFAGTISDKYFSLLFDQPQVNYIIAFILIIIVTIFVLALINFLVSRLLKASGISFIDRFLGFIFGALRGVFLCIILVLVISFIPGATKEEWWTKSNLTPFLNKLSFAALKYLPENIADYLEKEKTSNNNFPSNNKIQKELKIKILESINESAKESEQDLNKPYISKEIKKESIKNSNKSDADLLKEDDNSTIDKDKKSKLTLESYQ